MKESKALKRVSTAFHETFALSLPSVSGILELAISRDGDVTDEIIKDNVHLGNNYIKAMPRYARASGLLSFPGFEATTLGKFVHQHDPDLLNTSTMWLMHYHLSAPHGPGPLYWNHAITNLLKIGERVESAKLGKDIAQYILSATGDVLQDRTTKDSARVLLKTYCESDGLGALGLIKEFDNMYLIDEPEPPSAWVIGYALADYWDATFGDVKGINLSDVSSNNNLAGIFFMGSGLFMSKLSELQKEGMLQVQRVAPPYQLIKLWSNKNSFLERIYD